MIKRTKGLILLTLLVVTGFAGTINNTAPTNQERRFLINHLRNSRADLLRCINGLSATQLNFKQSPDRWSIKERFYYLALAEEGFWDMLEITMKEPAKPERKIVKWSDEGLVNAIFNQTKAMSFESFLPAKAGWQSMNEAQAVYNASRIRHLKYVKTTTEDLRNHFVELPFGPADCYQFILFIAAHCDRHCQQIKEIMADPSFPSN